MRWTIIESLLTLPLLYAIMATIVEFRYSKLRSFVVIGLAILCTVVMDYGLSTSSLGAGGLYSYAWLTTCIPSFLSLLYLAKFRTGSFLFAFLTECVLASITTALSYIFSYLLPWQNVLIPILIHVVLLVGVLIACRWLFREKLFEAVREQGNSWILYCVLPVFCLVIWVMYSASSVQTLDIENKVYIPYAGHLYPQHIWTLIVLLILFFYSLGLILVNITKTYQADTDRRNKLALDSEIRLLHDRLSSLEEKDASLRILRHDMRHHLSTLSCLVGNNEHMQEAQKYLKQLDHNLMQTKQVRYCSNAVINAIFSSYTEKAQRDGVMFSVAVKIPEILPVDVMDIGAVLSNALENALNACLRMDTNAERFINIKLVQHKKQFLLDISNSFSGTVDLDDTGRPVSCEENHGTGSQSIDAFARKYEATTDYSAQNNIFRLCMMFSKKD